MYKPIDDQLQMKLQAMTDTTIETLSRRRGMENARSIETNVSLVLEEAYKQFPVNYKPIYHK